MKKDKLQFRVFAFKGKLSDIIRLLKVIRELENILMTIT